MDVPDLSILTPPKLTKSLVTSPHSVFAAAISLRAVLLIYGLWQDAHSALKYTDIDYYVFTDAAQYVAGGHSPYVRATYRYTPLLTWLLLPTTWGGWWFSLGKAIFAASDIGAGLLILMVLKRRGIDEKRALKYSCAWLLNPMVANISTRGSSEGLLCVMVMALVWATEMHLISLAGMLLGLSVHLKIYPFIYGVSILWALETKTPLASNASIYQSISHFFNTNRVTLILTSLSVFSALNLSMYIIYGLPFMHHTYLHHLTRIDHRHNFSPYNTLLYISSSASWTSSTVSHHIESLAFIPQLLLSAILIPFALAKRDLPATMIAQTFAFVTFNKVCTSQYFLWYLVFLPIYLPQSSFMRRPLLGIAALALWIATQGLWLQQAYQLEFLGRSTFVPGLWGASLMFFAVNVWILGIMIGDIANGKGNVVPEARRLGVSRKPSVKSTVRKKEEDVDITDPVVEGAEDEVEEIPRPDLDMYEAIEVEEIPPKDQPKDEDDEVEEIPRDEKSAIIAHATPNTPSEILPNENPPATAAAADPITSKDEDEDEDEDEVEEIPRREKTIEEMVRELRRGGRRTSSARSNGNGNNSVLEGYVADLQGLMAHHDEDGSDSDLDY